MKFSFKKKKVSEATDTYNIPMQEACILACDKLKEKYPNYNFVYANKVAADDILASLHKEASNFDTDIVPEGGMIYCLSSNQEKQLLVIVDKDPNLAVNDNTCINGINAYNLYKSWLQNLEIFPVLYFYEGDTDLDFGNIYKIIRNMYHLHNKNKYDENNKIISIQQTPSCFYNTSHWTVEMMCDIIVQMAEYSLGYYYHDNQTHEQ